MQHYGLPTRLLDWSRSPLIAAYFAVSPYLEDGNMCQEDAVIWMLDPFKLNVNEGFEPITPPIDAHSCEALLTPAFTSNDIEAGTVRAVMGTETDLRMFVQQGCFTIHSRRSPLDDPPNSDNYLGKMVIPASNVRRFAEEIRICGFRRGDIYPDLTNLAVELKKSRQ